MINWCIEHPVRGKALSADDPRMRALEAYLLAQRKGKTLEYGKHGRGRGTQRGVRWAVRA